MNERSMNAGPMNVLTMNDWAMNEFYVEKLSGEMTSHHEKPVVMRLKLTNGELATTGAENASVMGPHLEKVYIKHRPVDWWVLHKLPQLHLMLELNTLISWK